MLQLEQLIRPTWGTEKWIDKAWSVLNDDEKNSIKLRLDDLFYAGLPFQLVHDKILYTHVFSLLTQIETLGMQVPLKFCDKLSTPELQKKMRQQLIDETFHAILFAKITHHLSAPYALPPAYNPSIERFMSHIADEPDLKTSLVLLNLIGEGWIEEVFITMQKHQIAPRVFDTVLQDESRHLEETELYLELGLPDEKYLKKRLGYFEEELVSTIFFQPQYVTSLVNVIGVKGVLELVNNIDKKHHRLLAKINLTPTRKWKIFMDIIPSYVQDIFHDHTGDDLVQPTVTRKTLTGLWGPPNNPTMSSVFSLNVTPLDFFEKKFPPETLTCLSIQAISKGLTDNPLLKNYMCHHKIYNPKHAYVGLAVQLPGCGDQLGLIEFKDCHNMTLFELSQHIQSDIKMMVYCFKKSEELKKDHPYLMDLFNEMFSARANEVFVDPLFAKPTICLSNIGQMGYDCAISPLFPDETVKFTLTQIEKKQVWNNQSKTFEVQDRLPIGMSVDHRVFDGNIKIPSIFQTSFDEMFGKMLRNLSETPTPIPNLSNLNRFIQLVEKILTEDLEFGFRYLFFSSHVWKNYNDPFTSQGNGRGLEAMVEDISSN